MYNFVCVWFWFRCYFIMSSSFLQNDKNEIERLIRINVDTQSIVILIKINNFQINKIKKNLIRYDVVIISSIFIKQFWILIENIKTSLFKYINLHFIKYLNEMCWFVFDMYNVIMNEITIYKILKRRKWIYKKINFLILT